MRVLLSVYGKPKNNTIWKIIYHYEINYIQIFPGILSQTEYGIISIQKEKEAAI